MLRGIHASSSYAQARGLAATALQSQYRGIRTQIPPRSAVTVITYLDRYGNPIKTKDETDLSLIRTRDNKFYLQRVLEDESIVRFAAPGLGMIKNSANFEYFSIAEIDIYGGVVVPADLMPTPQHERPCSTAFSSLASARSSSSTCTIWSSIAIR
jgi:hypothetical protein